MEKSRLILILGFLALTGGPILLKEAEKYEKSHPKKHTILGPEHLIKRDFSIPVSSLNSLKTIHQIYSYTTKADDGSLVNVNLHFNGKFIYNKDKNLDGIIDARGVCNYRPISSDTTLMSEYSVRDTLF